MTVFRDLIQQLEHVTGNVIIARDLTALRRVVDGRLQATGASSYDAYLRLLQSDPTGPEWRQLVSHITVKESYLFRGPQQFEALATHVLPQLARDIAPEISLRVWSAGCARGEEAATLAIVLSESQALIGRQWDILATDVDEDALERASSGRFGRRAVSRVPSPLLDRYFIAAGTEYELIPALRRRIVYRYLNLIHGKLPVEDGTYHLILLRNVLIYFRKSSQQGVLAEMARTLAGRGRLFLGPTEAMWGISKVLEPEELPGCFAYRHPPSEAEISPRHRRSRPRSTSSNLAGGTPPRKGSCVGMDETAEKLCRPPSTVVPDTVDLAGLAHSLGDGASTEVEGRLRSFVKDHSAGPEAYLLLGISCDRQGRIEPAVEAYRAALYLRPDFFHARFLLAESLRKLGWEGRAVGEYRRVIGLLAAGGGAPSAYASELSLPDRELVLARSEAALAP